MHRYSIISKLRLTLGGWGETRLMGAGNDTCYKYEEKNMLPQKRATSKGMVRSSVAGTEKSPFAALSSLHPWNNALPTGTVVSQAIVILDQQHNLQHLLLIACCAFAYGPRQPYPNTNLIRSSDSERFASSK